MFNYKKGASSFSAIGDSLAKPSPERKQKTQNTGRDVVIDLPTLVAEEEEKKLTRAQTMGHTSDITAAHHMLRSASLPLDADDVQTNDAFADVILQLRQPATENPLRRSLTHTCVNVSAAKMRRCQTTPAHQVYIDLPVTTDDSKLTLPSLKRSGFFNLMIRNPDNYLQLTKALLFVFAGPAAFFAAESVQEFYNHYDTYKLLCDLIHSSDRALSAVIELITTELAQARKSQNDMAASQLIDVETYAQLSVQVRFYELLIAHLQKQQSNIRNNICQGLFSGIYSIYNQGLLSTTSFALALEAWKESADNTDWTNVLNLFLKCVTKVCANHFTDTILENSDNIHKVILMAANATGMLQQYKATDACQRLVRALQGKETSSEPTMKDSIQFFENKFEPELTRTLKRSLTLSRQLTPSSSTDASVVDTAEEKTDDVVEANENTHLLAASTDHKLGSKSQDNSPAKDSQPIGEHIHQDDTTPTPGKLTGSISLTHFRTPEKREMEFRRAQSQLRQRHLTTGQDSSTITPRTTTQRLGRKK